MTAQEESYSGDSSYKYVDELINDQGQELMVVSPYISEYYASILAGLSGRKRIRVITSRSSLGYSSLGRHMSASLATEIKIIVFASMLDAASIYLHFLYTTAILTAIIAIVAAFAHAKRKRRRENMQVKISDKRFIHEKIYIGKGSAIVGSANLTYNGMHKNIEHIELIKEPEKISNLREHFEALWKTT